jgi:hypothetical protein
MNHNKRILKTGALAVVVTIAFGIFAYRAAEWSRGFNSGFIVLGQTGTAGGGSNGCSTGGSGTGSVAVTKVVPQIVAGSYDGGFTKYTTVIEVVNTSGIASSINANFYNVDGTALTGVTLTAGTSSVTNGVISAASIAKDAVYVVSGGGTTAAGVTAWGKITSCGSFSVSTFFEIRDGVTNVLYSRVGVAASRADLSNFVIPRVRDVAAGLDVGFALVNTGSTSASITATLKDATGAVVTGGTKTITMLPGSHQSVFTKDFFGLLNEPTGRNYQYITFTSTSSTFAAIALAIEGATETSFPVDPLG